MKRALLLSFVLVLTLPVLARDYEKLMLPIAPSVTYCGYHSKYDTRLVAFNGAQRGIDRFCSDEICGPLAPNTGTVVIGENAGGSPPPAFMYVPKDVAADMQMS